MFTGQKWGRVGGLFASLLFQIKNVTTADLFFLWSGMSDAQSISRNQLTCLTPSKLAKNCFKGHSLVFILNKE